jgi:DNA-binding response OmpR family regulator
LFIHAKMIVWVYWGCKMKILLVEDEIMLAEAITQVLRNNNYSVDIAQDGEYGLDCALTGIYDIIILDLMLPKKDGISVLRELRREGIKSHVILLTAKSQMEDKVTGLDSGADDYLAKPFQIPELLARLRALLRRKGELYVGGILSYKDIEFDPHKLKVKKESNVLKLTLKESQILELLIAGKGTPVSKDLIIEKLWGYETDAEDSHVESHVSLLRKKLKELNSNLLIKAQRGLGYTLSD